MSYTCPTCAGSGIVNGSVCYRCRGNRTLVEDSQGLTVTWGSVDLGQLTGISIDSATASMDDVTGLNSPVVSVGTHHVMIRQLITGDITPGKASVRYMGANGLTDGHVGTRQLLRVVHPRGAVAWALRAVLLKFTQSATVNNLIEGTAEFQFQEV